MMKMILLFPLIAFTFLATMPSTIIGNRFAVSNSTSMKYCLILEANITGTLYYSTNKYASFTNFTVPEEGFGFVEVNQNGSFCAEKESKLQLDFVPEFQPEEVSPLEAQEKWSIILQFEKVGTCGCFKVANYSLTVHYNQSMNSTDTNGTTTYIYSSMEDKQFQGKWDAVNAALFNCSKNCLSLPLKGESDFAIIQFDNLKIASFVDQDQPVFDQNQAFEQCKEDLHTSNLAPIILGISLSLAGTLIMVMLIAYLNERATAECQGYASMP